jgi:carbonic anhydrase
MLRTLYGAALGTLLRQPAGPFPSFAEHGADWADKCKATVTALQSPLDFDGEVVGAPAGGAPFEYNYPVYAELELENDGTAVMVRNKDPAPGAQGGIRHPEVGWHDLKYARVRAGAEHTIKGHRAALELQLVHKKPMSMVIVSFLFDLPKGETLDTSKNVLANYSAPPPGGNPVLDAMVRKRPPRMQEKVTENTTTLDLKSLFDGATFLEYSGTDTLPPCANAVWMVAREPLLADADQLAVLHQVSFDLSEDHGNFRWVQPGNARPVVVRSGGHAQIQQNPPAEPYQHGPAYGPYMGKDDTVFAGDQMAKDVMTIEKYVADYAHDLDHRLQAAAQARVAPPPVPTTPPPPPYPKLNPSDPLYKIKTLNHAQKLFRKAVEDTLRSDEVATKLAKSIGRIASAKTRGKFTAAANMTTPSGGASMNAAMFK